MATLTKTKSKRKAAQSKAYRFDARLNEGQKVLIQKAADLEGRTMTDFVLRSAEAAAERTLQDRVMLLLSARETEVFVEAILNPAKPGHVLRTAAGYYSERHTAAGTGRQFEEEIESLRRQPVNIAQPGSLAQLVQ